MFKNPLKKYRPGGSAPSQGQQELAEFIQWLPTRVKEFEGAHPDQIAQAINELWASDEGKKQVMSWLEQFKNETKGVTSAFAGGKLHDFICKHARGGYIQGCGCGSKVPKGEDGIPDGIGARFKKLYNKFIGVKVPDSGPAVNRTVKTWIDKNGVKHLVETANVNGYTADSYVDVLAPGDTTVRQDILGRGGIKMRNYPVGSDEYNAVVGRNRQYIPEDKCGGKVNKTKK